MRSARWDVQLYVPSGLGVALAIEEGQLLQEEDVVPLGRIALCQDGHPANHVAAGLVHQVLHGLQGAAGGDHVVQDQDPAVVMERSFTSNTPSM